MEPFRLTEESVKLFLVEPSNRHRVPLLEESEGDDQLLAGWCWHALKPSWHPLQYTLYAASENEANEPDICKCVGAGITFRLNLLGDIFPKKPDEIELLPVLVDSKDWLFVNCLKTTKGYDTNRSKFLRDSEGDKQIFLINYVVVTDASVKDAELFTLEDSNRAWVIATESFVERIKSHKLNGLGFREIGFLDC